MLDEGVQIMRQAWTEGRATLDGRHYQVDGAIVRPLPLQEGGIPLWIAGGGEKVTLKIAAKYAQYTNFAASSPEEFVRKSEILEGHCETVGTDYDKIVRSSNFNVAIGETEAEVQQRIDAAREQLAKYVGAEKAEAAIAQQTANGAGAGVGTPAQIVEKLGKLRDLGMTYGIFNFSESAYDQSGIELFEREVIPHLR
jgi:alkanesulfonate monooxygenase SsuD/methylene tetrahydromethanopterin reductase-like flavin-dependent oxidoreductase (luciferase family)